MKNTYVRWISITLGTSLLLLVIVGSINFFVDPGNAYYKKIKKDEYLDVYVEKLLNSNVGMAAHPNERAVKYRLAKLSDRSSYVIGSSRSMDFSSYRNGSIAQLSGELMNLGVSGGSFEDLVIYSGLLLEHRKAKKVFFVLDPWTLKFNMDRMWQEYETDYYRYAKQFGIPAHQDITANFEKIKNLFNLQYLGKSLQLLKSEGINSIYDTNYSQMLNEVQQFDINKGIETSVTLTDGAFVYPKSYAENPPFFNGGYKISDQHGDPAAIEAFGKIISALRSAGIETYIVMTPYHPLIFTENNQPASIKDHIRIEESIIINTAQKFDIPYFGSFDPQSVGCHPEDFHDDKHPKVSCLDKIDFLSESKPHASEQAASQVLDGELEWKLDLSASGIKYVKLEFSQLKSAPASSLNIHEQLAELLDGNGNIIPHIQGMSWSAEPVSEFFLYVDNGELILSLTDEQTGWADGFKPTDDDIKAYFKKNPYTIKYLTDKM